MSKTNTPFRYDYVGSFLRPAELKQARADFQGGKIGADELKAVEDQAIRELVAKQQGAGYHVITDGEFRRATWHLDFMWGFHGVGHSRTEKGLPFHGENAMLDDTYLTGEVGVDSHPFVEHFRFVKALEDENTVAKLTIPAPAQFLEQMVMPFAMENTSKYYPNTEKLVEDLAAGYRKVIADVYAAGCRNLQFDDCSWGMLVAPKACMIFDTDEKGLEAIKEQMLTANNLAIEGKPEDTLRLPDRSFEDHLAVGGVKRQETPVRLTGEDPRGGPRHLREGLERERRGLALVAPAPLPRDQVEARDAGVGRLHDDAARADQRRNLDVGSQGGAPDELPFGVVDLDLAAVGADGDVVAVALRVIVSKHGTAGC